LVDAVVAAKGAATPGEDFELAPATEGQIVGTDRKIVASDAAAWESARNDHAGSRIRDTIEPWHC